VALSKVNRLSSREDFRAVFRSGIRRYSDRMTLRALRIQDATPEVKSKPAAVTKKVDGIPTRIGISISTKVSKKAVIRNRIKRQLRAAFRYLLPRISPGWILVVVVQPAAARQECVTQQFLQELEQLLVAAEVLNGNS
jgi:ribonuclease P protein component